MTTSRTVPDAPAALPLLQTGSHRRPEEGSCLMEFVSVLAGTRFTDRPRCTDPALARLARMVNDGVSDAARTRLAVLAPDLVDARGRGGMRAVVLAHLADAGLAVAPGDRWLLRLREQVRSHRTAEGGRLRRAWRRVSLAGDTTFALGHVASLIAHADPAERDDRFVVLLEGVVREVRTPRGAPETASAGVDARASA